MLACIWRKRAAFQILVPKLRPISSLSIEMKTSMPGEVVCISVKRRASALYLPMISSGSRELPSDLDILRPCASRTTPCRTTLRNGTSPMNRQPAMIMRATQKKMMSGAVQRSVVG